MPAITERTDWIGTAKRDVIIGNEGNNQLYGNAGNDVLTAGEGGGVNVFVGGAGQDRLIAGSGADTFRFTTESDSYYDSTGSHSDLIIGFDPTQDMLDISNIGDLGGDGIGAGFGGKLDIVYNETLDRTYVRSYEHYYIPGADLKYFQVALQGDYRETLTNDNFWDLQARDRFDDTLTGTDDGEETLFGDLGRDTLDGAGGDDRIIGGEDGDRLTGGSGADTFFYNSVEDSFRTDTTDVRGRDLITDFSAADGDLIDLSLLGFTGIGNGHDGTLKVTVNAAGTQTALKSLDPDANGHSFELMFTGNLRTDLNQDTVIFASNDTAAVIEHEIGIVGVAADIPDIA